MKVRLGWDIKDIREYIERRECEIKNRSVTQASSVLVQAVQVGPNYTYERYLCATKMRLKRWI